MAKCKSLGGCRMTREEALKIIDCYDIGFYDLSGEKIPADKLADAFDMAIEALSEPRGDLISRADAMAEFREWVKRANENGETPTWNDAVSLIGSLPSAEAEPTVIRSRTLLPTKDFKEWAKRIREVNPNAVVIPCDAEVVSADAVQGEWKPFDLTWGRNVYFCTACQTSTEVPTVNGQPSYNFCPNCGARMKGGDTE